MNQVGLEKYLLRDLNTLIFCFPEKSLQGDYFTCNEEIKTFLKDITVAVKKLVLIIIFFRLLLILALTLKLGSTVLKLPKYVNRENIYPESEVFFFSLPTNFSIDCCSNFQAEN